VEKKMSGLRSLIKESKIAKKELVASTVRIPKELNSFVEDLAEYLSLSKQDVMLKLLEEGATIAEDELKLDDIEEEIENNSFHILNTNKRHSIADHEFMIKNGVAAAFYDPWKFNINRIHKDDIVFLYENGKGIVAYGKGTGNTLIKDHNEDKDECHFQELEAFVLLDPPLSAGEIKKILGRNIVFLRTMSGIPDGQQVLDKILSEKIA
jgi:hypothetical protein